MKYIIRKAGPEDLDSVLKIYAFARRTMAQSGNPNQWGNTNPPESVLVEDIRKGQLYLMEAPTGIHGAFALIPGEDPTYHVICDGEWSSNSPYQTIHRLAGDGSGGIFDACLLYCTEVSDYIRIDTHEDNRIMQHLLQKNGFTCCGVIHLANGDPRFAYDLKKERSGIL